MICNVYTCNDCRYLENEQDDQANFNEFLTDCQHAKCKVVHLVRQQISKLQNMQYKHFLITRAADNENEKPTEIYKSPSEMHETYHTAYEMHAEMQEPSYDDTYEMKSRVHQIHDETEVQEAAPVRRIIAKNNLTTLFEHLTSSDDRVTNRKWILRVLDRVRRRAYLILVAAVIGVIVWTALIYGVFLGATACGNSRICSASFKYTHAKRSLF